MRRSSGKACPQGYFKSRVIEVIAGGRLEDLQELALELLVSEVYLRSLLEKSGEENLLRDELLSNLEEIEEVKKVIYRVYRLMLVESTRPRVVGWR